MTEYQQKHGENSAPETLGSKLWGILFIGVKNGKAVPKLWKTAILCPVYKGKGRGNDSNSFI